VTKVTELLKLHFSILGIELVAALGQEAGQWRDVRHEWIHNDGSHVCKHKAATA
jgi:hypothetical protein